MKLSTRTTYGLRAMMALAEHYGQGPLMVREISEQHGLPATYLEQIMVPLRKGGLVNATRGARGGYTLVRPPAEMTVLEVVEVLEGPLELVECRAIDHCTVEPAACALKELLDAGTRALAGVFGSTTLADLAERQRTLAAGSALVYVI